MLSLQIPLMRASLPTMPQLIHNILYAPITLTRNLPKVAELHLLRKFSIEKLSSNRSVSERIYIKDLKIDHVLI